MEQYSNECNNMMSVPAVRKNGTLCFEKDDRDDQTCIVWTFSQNISSKTVHDSIKEFGNQHLKI
jgi:hypothetical protein